MQLQLYGKTIWLFKGPVDFRKSIDGLSYIVSDQFELNPAKGIYIFYNKKRDKLKCLCWHKNGFILLYKRLEKCHFKFDFKSKDGKLPLKEETFGWLLAGLDWQLMSQWSELDYSKFS